MKQDEAEKLAREILRQMTVCGEIGDCLEKRLCDHILSGDMKREIENAAYERAALDCEQEAEACLSDIVEGDEFGRREANARAGALVTAAADIRALIQPPAQKEDGE